MTTRKQSLILILAAIFIAATALTTWYVWHIVCHTPFSLQKSTVYLYIDRDDNIDSVQTKLRVLSTPQSMWFFKKLSHTMGYDSIIHSGRYAIEPNMSVVSIIRHLRIGNQSPIKITIQPTRSIHKLSARLSDQLLIDSAEWSTCFTDSAFCNKWNCTPDNLFAFILPNSYEVYWDITTEQFMHRMNREYQNYWNAERIASAKKQGLTPQEVVVLASIVDQETNYNPEKSRIAGLYLNRLKRGMPLQADPTVKYAIKDWGLRRILHKHLTYDSPYNTYLHKGLPPTPIVLPALSSIEAVLHPENNSYLYMCAKEDFSGQHNFATTYTQHLQNARKYTQALNKRKIK